MKKPILYLLCSFALLSTISCSKDEAEPEVVNGAATISTDTGLSFTNAQGFSADYITFKLRHGTGDGKEYGQNLSSYNHIELEQGFRTIYQMKAFDNGEEVSFQPFTYDADGNRIEIESTSIIEISKNEVLQILLEKAE